MPLPCFWFTDVYGFASPQRTASNCSPPRRLIMKLWKLHRLNSYYEENETRRSRQLFFAMVAAVLATLAAVLPAFVGMGTSPSLR